MLWRRKVIKLLSLEIAGTCKGLCEPVQFIPEHLRIKTNTDISESADLLLYLPPFKSFCQHRCTGWRPCLLLCQRTFIARPWPKEELCCYPGLFLVAVLSHLMWKIVNLEKLLVASCWEMWSRSLTGRVLGRNQQHGAGKTFPPWLLWLLVACSLTAVFWGVTIYVWVNLMAEGRWPLLEQNWCAHSMHWTCIWAW